MKPKIIKPLSESIEENLYDVKSYKVSLSMTPKLGP